MVLTILNFFVQKTIDFAKNLEMMEIKGVEDHVICVISFISVFSYHIKFKPMLATWFMWTEMSLSLRTLS